MKKLYSKPAVKKLIKGAASDYKESQEVHTTFIKYDKFNPLPIPLDGMTPEELRIHQQAFLNKIPIHGGDKLQQLYDFDLKYLKSRNLGYTEALYIRNLKQYLTEISLDGLNLHNQIRAEIFLSFLEDQQKLIPEPEMKEVDFSSLLARSVHQEMLNDILKTCQENLPGIKKIKTKDYAALYMIIYERHKNIFRTGTNFVDVQRILDKFFDQDTHNYKKSNLKEKIEWLEYCYPWIEKLHTG